MLLYSLFFLLHELLPIINLSYSVHSDTIEGYDAPMRLVNNCIQNISPDLVHVHGV